MSYSNELDIARRAAHKAGELQIKHRQKPMDTLDRKYDRSPVTEVDRRCEELIMGMISRRFPRDGLLGEESGEVSGENGRRWIVDPLDGTRPYVRGIRTYGTLIALEDDGQPVVGVIHLPALSETYWAARGSGAFLNARPVRVSSESDLRLSMGSALGPVWDEDDTNASGLRRLLGKLDYSYGFMDSYSYASVASGRLEVCISLLDKPWDCAAPACIVREAGGRMTDIHGTESIHEGTVVMSNGAVHESVLEFFRR